MRRVTQAPPPPVPLPQTTDVHLLEFPDTQHYQIYTNACMKRIRTHGRLKQRFGGKTIRDVRFRVS